MGEMPTCYTLKKPKANKGHRCCECGGVIEKGEIYNLHSGIWEGEPASFKVCTDCEDLRKQVMCDCDLHYDETPALGFLVDDLENDHLEAFVAIKKKRGATIPDWMQP